MRLEGKETVAGLGENAHFVYLDVTKEEQWQATIKQITEEQGVLDILVNNAGISVFNSLENTSQDEFMRTIEINQLSVFLVMKTSVGLMKKANQLQSLMFHRSKDLKEVLAGMATSALNLRSES